MHCMIKKIDILGIQLDNYTVREAIRQVETFLDNGMLNTIECVSMQMLLDSEENPVLRKVLNNLDLAVISEKEILQAAGIDTMQRLKETEENDFCLEFFKRMERGRKRVFLLGQTEAATAEMRERLEQEYPKLPVVGDYAIDQCTGDLENVINDMNVTAPDVIVSVLPTPLQEHFFGEHSDKMCANIWFGLGEDGLVRTNHGLKGFLRSRMNLEKLRSRMEKYQSAADSEEGMEN